MTVFATTSFAIHRWAFMPSLCFTNAAFLHDSVHLCKRHLNFAQVLKSTPADEAAYDRYTSPHDFFSQTTFVSRENLQ